MAEAGAIVGAIYATMEETTKVIGKCVLKLMPEEDKVEIEESGNKYVVLKDFGRKLSFEGDPLKEYEDEVKTYGLSLAQAYALVWQDDQTGEIDGETFAKAILYNAVMLDLVFQGKLALSLVAKKTGCISWKETRISVTETGKKYVVDNKETEEKKDSTEEGQSADILYTALNDILTKLEKKNKDTLHFGEYCADAGLSGKKPKIALKGIMHSMENLKIVSSEQKKTWMGLSHKTIYPTHNPEVENKLRKGLRETLATWMESGDTGNAYMKMLLLCFQRADKEYMFSKTFAKSLCTPEERSNKDKVKAISAQLKGYGKAIK